MSDFNNPWGKGSPDYERWMGGNPWAGQWPSRSDNSTIAPPLPAASISLTELQKAQLVATVVAESAQGDWNMRCIAWVYVNLIGNYGFNKGMRRSAAFHTKGSNDFGPQSPNHWYKAYLITLGFGDEWKENKPPASAKMTVGTTSQNERQAKTIQEYVTGNQYYIGVIVPRIDEMRSFVVDEVLAKQDQNPLIGFHNQGYYGDLNGWRSNDDFWHQARRYFWMVAEDKLDGRWMEVVGDGKNATFLFNSDKIMEYFKENPDMIPNDRSKIPLLTAGGNLATGVERFRKNSTHKCN